ncbi:MAG: site-2 protease family protein [Acidobacteriota bacterium]
MRWSIHLGTLLGIPVRVHATFFLLLLWIAWRDLGRGLGTVGTLASVAFVIALFGCVALHEFGHALAARYYGIGTRDITLLPIGGLARLERMPQKPVQELVVALAGPAVNVVLAVLLFVQLQLFGPLLPASAGVMGIPFETALMFANIGLVLFNLIPAFPMDGGRVLRACMGFFVPFPKATRWAANVGKLIAAAFVLFGLIPIQPGAGTNPVLALIGFFVWWSASREAAFVQRIARLDGIDVRQAMLTQFPTLSPLHTLAHANQFFSLSPFRALPVSELDRPIGILTRDAFAQALQQQGADTAVRNVMTTRFQTASPEEPLSEALDRLRTNPGNLLPVVLGAGTWQGLLTPEGAGRFMR